MKRFWANVRELSWAAILGVLALVGVWVVAVFFPAFAAVGAAFAVTAIVCGILALKE